MQTTRKLEPILLEGRVKLKITKDILDKINYLCQAISQVEWSGLLFYKVNGSLRKVEQLTLQPMEIFLMDKGNATFTSYNFDDEVANYIMDRTMEDAEFFNYKIGHIHSHNHMGVFFSGTDKEELIDNAPHHNFYLSLIVNNKLDMEAKLAYQVKPTSFEAKDEKGDGYKINFKSEDNRGYMFVHDCEIIRPELPKLKDASFVARVAEVISRPSKKVEVKGYLEQGKNNKGAGGHKDYTQNFPSAKEGLEWKHVQGQGWMQVPIKKGEEAPSRFSQRPSNFRENNPHKENAPWKDAEDPFQEAPEEGVVNLVDDLDDTDRFNLDSQFAMYLLRFGTRGQNKEDDLEDAIEELVSRGMVASEISNRIISDYSTWYNNFYRDLDTVEIDDFMDTLETVLMCYEEVEAKYDFLPAVIRDLRQFGVDIENKWREAVLPHA